MRMHTRRPHRVASLALALALAIPARTESQVTQDVPAGRPDATIDLATREGAGLARTQWRYRDAAIVPVGHRAPGPDLRPSGPPNRTHDLVPKAGTPEFDAGPWEPIDAASLDRRRGSGRLSFAWYRASITIPDRVGPFDPRGSAAVFEIVVDDYSEIWVDGRLVPVIGQAGGGMIRGWNAPNRVILGRDVQPGQRFDVAVFAANGPLSQPPGNFIWIRSATVDFYRDRSLGLPLVTGGQVHRLDPGLDAIVAPDAMIERIITGFEFTEGPVWMPDGHLLFSDPNANTIYRWTPDGAVSVFRTKSGYSGTDIGEYRQPGSNGLTLDAEGRLTINEHGRRRVVRLESNGVVTVLADRFDGKRLNSPNDLVYRRDGSLYFTDPPFGLPRVFDDPRKELPVSGIYRLADGRVTQLATDLAGPNGLAFSPDERYLYVGNWDVARKVIMRYPVRTDGTLGSGEVFLDVTTGHPGEQAWDGIKVDQAGNVYAAGPGGIWILSPAGKHLGTIAAPETPANMAFGDDDARTLYMTARSSIYRIRLNVPGIRPAPAPRTARSTP